MRTDTTAGASDKGTFSGERVAWKRGGDGCVRLLVVGNKGCHGVGASCVVMGDGGVMIGGFDSGFGRYWGVAVQYAMRRVSMQHTIARAFIYAHHLGSQTHLPIQRVFLGHGNMF